jgi:2-keto-4-pentenoate hydratase
MEVLTVPDTMEDLRAGDVDLVAALMAARRGGAAVGGCGDPLSLDRAYAVQAQVFAETGDRLVGYKLAATSNGGQAALGVDTPLVGLLGAAELMPAAVAPATPRPLYAEAELVVRIGADLPTVITPPSSSSLATLADHVDAVFAGIELCSSRFADDDVDASALVADNCLFHALVLGDRLADRWDERLAHCPVTLWQDDALRAEGTTEAALGHPLRAVVWLAHWLGRQGRGLRTGEYVATGSTTGITPVSQDAPIVARFGDFGAVQARIELG